jgi:hypothetical protein
MAVGLLLHIYPRNCKGQCCMVIALIFRDVAKHLTFGGGGGGGVSDVKWSSFYKDNDLFTQILHENVKIYSILEFYLSFTVVGFTPPAPLSLRPC